MSLAEELGAAAAAATAYGEVSAVLAADTVSRGRAYLVALGEDDAREWLVLDASLAPVTDREEVREVASIVCLSELAVELAGGGQLEELRARLDELGGREGAEPAGAASEAAAELERVIGQPPRVASPAFLDRVGDSTRRLERELGEHDSPLAGALAAHAGTVEAFAAEVESRHRVPLR